MDEQGCLTEQFEANRTHLRAVAYRMLGSPSEADDAVQETWVRLSRADTRDVTNLGGWLTTVLARVCVDMLRSRTARREESLDWRGHDLVAGQLTDADPEHEAVLADSVGIALLLVLDTLVPAGGWRSCCTTCAPGRSTRARASTGARRQRHGNFPPWRGAECRALRRRRTRI
jgi:RNA polymerase sigma-70 factor (ECF subfamily)